MDELPGPLVPAAKSELGRLPKSRILPLIHRVAEKLASRLLARAIGSDEAPGLFTEGFYRYSVLSISLDVSNHHPNLLA